MKLWQLALALAFLLIIGDMVRGIVRGGWGPEEVFAPAEARAPAEVPDRTEYSEVWGAEAPKVVLQAYLPRGNATAERVVRALRTVVSRRPTAVRADVLDMNHPHAKTALEMRDIKMPVVAVNSKTAFSVLLRGKRTQVSLEDVARLKALPLEDVLDQIVSQELKARPAK